MVKTWGSCFSDDLDYFNISERDTNYRRNLVALSFIRMSMDCTLFQSTTSQLYMPNARSTYQALRKRFSKASWSAIVQHASRIFMPSDQSTNLLQHSLTVQASLDALQSQIGPLTAENVAPIILFFSAPQLQDQITTLAPESSSAIQLSRLESSKRENFCPKQKSTSSRHPNSPRPSMTAQSIDQKSPDWKKKWLTSRNPCFYCGGTGHWAPNFPIKLKAEEAQSKHGKIPSVSSLGVIPSLESNEALLDSGATHSVVGDVSLFTHISPTNLLISVASRHRFIAEGIGTVRLNTPNGTLQLNNVLYCKAIPGIVISLGRLFHDRIQFFFSKNNFFLRQNGILFSCFFYQYQWFLPIISNFPTNPSINPISTQDGHDAPPINLATKPISFPSDLATLWHRRIGHLSLRNIKRMIKHDAVGGLPSSFNHNISICHDCLISKSIHLPVSTPSRNHIWGPGDLVVADLVGPLPLSYNNMKYVLVIQDFAS
ncbi:hypothetical protein O181_075689 [Austropuccinia psidii MF-1]|uniref:GAG-pre-integrase domain-containing protein n=1 Tax=Austropuccinia psidii MF-1 TaxID=1389203 RepID=A0A9Q3IEP9_9BASI|nr:hypothetical protein [Austropuccinia psidii MF-1]